MAYKLVKFLLTEMNNIGLEDLMVGLPQGQGLEEGRPLDPKQLGVVLQNARQAGLRAVS